ncbi:hypothetical protein HDU67_002142, partial [Dinochytrium kinnereticum]
MAVVGPVGWVRAENIDTDRGNGKVDDIKILSISFEDRQNEPETPCITASGKVFMYPGKTAVVKWDKELVANLVGNFYLRFT